MNTLMSLGLIVAMSVGLVSAAPQEQVVRRSNPKHYRIGTRVTVHNRGAELSRLVVDIPLPASCPEQDVGKVELVGARDVISGDGHLRYAMFDLDSKELPKPGESRTMLVSYEVTLYDIEVDFSRIGSIRPYDRESPIFRAYTPSKLPLIDVGEPRLLKVAAELWQRSNGNVVEYARAAYLYVARNYRFLNPMTGFHPLEELLNQGGGDCGNLSSIYITLLRMRGIPARHIVCNRPGNNPHVWAEFYLEELGWIPVDVTNKNAHPKRDYFGTIRHDTNGIILHKDVRVEVQSGDGLEIIDGIQGFAWWYDGRNLKKTLKADFKIRDKGRWWKFWY